MFYFVEPSEENFSQYEKWVSSARQSEVFFGDMVKNCYKCSVKPGQTMFIPTGKLYNNDGHPYKEHLVNNKLL